MSLDWFLLGFRVLAAIILYIFLGAALYIIWRDLKAVAPAWDEPCLRVLETGTDGVNAGQLFPLKPVTFLGRTPENDIIISDLAASARHARLSCANSAWWLEDLGSKNGTTLNDLYLSNPVTLTGGDVIGIGNWQLRFETGQE
jgi:hypothetical protein